MSDTPTHNIFYKPNRTCLLSRTFFMFGIYYEFSDVQKFVHKENLITICVYLTIDLKMFFHFICQKD